MHNVLYRHGVRSALTLQSACTSLLTLGNYAQQGAGLQPYDPVRMLYYFQLQCDGDLQCVVST